MMNETDSSVPSDNSWNDEMTDFFSLRGLDAEDMSQLVLLSTISEMLNESYDIESVLDRVMDVVVHTMNAQRAFVMLDRGGEKPEIAAFRGINPEILNHKDFRYSMTIVRKVLDSGQPLLSLTAVKDPRFADSGSLKFMGTRSVLCVPMRTRSQNIGLVYLDNMLVDSAFGEGDLELLNIIAGLAASAIERAQYFSQLLQNEKMAALGLLVAGIAHELGNPVQTIKITAQYLQKYYSSDPRAMEIVENMDAAATRCQNLVRQLLNLSHRDSTPLRHVNLSEFITDVTNLMKVEFRNDEVTLFINVADDLPQILISPEKLTELLINLLNNARQAVRGRDNAMVCLSVIAHDDNIRIIISDNGPGIPPQYLRRIFEPFYTTKPPGEGTGLGLSICRSIAGGFGGTIQARNNPSGGAVFTFELPIAEKTDEIEADCAK